MLDPVSQGFQTKDWFLNKLTAVAIGPDPDVHQSSYSSGTSTAHAHLPEYQVKYNTLSATTDTLQIY